jgi:two-component system sensor histidine kinase BaeS
MSLRRRVLAYMAVAAITSCALTVGVAVVLVRHKVSTQRITALEREADVLAAVGGAPGALGPGDHVYRVGSKRPRRLGVVVASAVLAAIPASGDADGTIDVGGRTLLYVARATAAGRIVLVRGSGLGFAEWGPFLWSLLLAGLGGAVLAAGLSYLLARRLTKPLAELSAATVRLASGQPGVSVPVDGKDELADLAEAFNVMSRELERAREAERTFLVSASHELKTPLTSIRGYAEAVQEGAVPPGEAGRIIAAEADRLERLVRDLLDLASLGRAEFAVARHPVDLAGVVAHAVDRHRPRAHALSVELSGEAAEESWAVGDEDRLLQATSNLIENSLRLTPSGGRITVAASPGRIVVRDTGPGLSPEDLPRAFERFYLHDRYRSERPVSSGLGLAIVKELVAAMGGSVQAAMSADGGAEFTLMLPAVAEPAVRGV